MATLTRPPWLQKGAFLQHRPSGIFFHANRLGRYDEDGVLFVGIDEAHVWPVHECILALNNQLLHGNNLLMLPEGLHVIYQDKAGTVELPIGMSGKTRFSLRPATVVDTAAGKLASFFDGDVISDLAGCNSS